MFKFVVALSIVAALADDGTSDRVKKEVIVAAHGAAGKPKQNYNLFQKFFTVHIL